MRYKVKITIELEVEADTAENAIVEAENIELPTGYIENSYDLLDVSEMADKKFIDYPCPKTIAELQTHLESGQDAYCEFLDGCQCNDCDQSACECCYGVTMEDFGQDGTLDESDLNRVHLIPKIGD